MTGDPNLIFLSDGYGQLNPTIATQVVNSIKTKGGNVSAFGIGEASTIKTLQKIDPTAIRITDFQQLVVYDVNLVTILEKTGRLGE